MVTILWHDYETFGTDPALDRPSQFAAIRTNLDLEPVGDPIMLYCQPSADVLPSIDACLITGITPQEATEKGVSEPEFARGINDIFMEPGTCGAGYNSIRFDDEVTRHCLYRNFHDPYAREWQNGNSRWDIIDMARLAYALRPEGIKWPITELGLPSFRLELLTAENSLSHELAHDALSDVRATIGFAKLIRDTHPKLYDFCWKLRDKNHAGQMIDLHSKKPLIHVSSKISAARGCTTLIMPVAAHPQNKNGVLCIDLMEEPDGWLELDVQEMRRRLYTRVDDLAEDEARLPLKTVHLNRSPILCPLTMMDAKAADRLGIDLDKCERNWQRLLDIENLDSLLRDVVSESQIEARDVEASLYTGFIDRRDRAVCDRVIRSDSSDLSEQQFLFEDTRLTELLFRYRARHFPESLTEEEIGDWEEHIRARYFTRSNSSSSTDENQAGVYECYQADLEKRMLACTNAHEQRILGELKKWMLDFHHRYKRA